MKIIAFFNNKGGVGKTSLVYHLAWMLARNGVRTLAVDLDPQANLTSMFLTELELTALWPDAPRPPRTVFGAVQPILKGLGDISAPHTQELHPALHLVPGDLSLSKFEDKLSDAWPRCHNGDEAAFRTMTAFYRLIVAAAGDRTDIVLMDVGPNLGAINRAALIAADCVVVPMAPDLFSLQGLRNLGPSLRDWRATWTALRGKAPADVAMPPGSMQPLGYVVMQHAVRDNRPVKAYQQWLGRIPMVYRTEVLGEKDESNIQPTPDPNALAQLKHYRSLMPLAMEANKPMFDLKPADGAIGAHIEAVRACYQDFAQLAQQILRAAGVGALWSSGEAEVA